MAHGLLRRPVRTGERAVLDGDDEATDVRVEQTDLRPAPAQEGGRVDDPPRAVDVERPFLVRLNRRERVQARARAPLTREVHDPLRGAAHRLLELLLDVHDDLGTHNEARLAGEQQDSRLRIRSEGDREQLAGERRADRGQVALRIDRGRLLIAVRHEGRSYSEDGGSRIRAIPEDAYRMLLPDGLH